VLAVHNKGKTKHESGHYHRNHDPSPTTLRRLILNWQRLWAQNE